MGFMHIENLYKNQDILIFKQCYAMEKVHGTSAHISYNNGEVGFFSGGEKYEKFCALFDKEFLQNKFKEMCEERGLTEKVIVYGEAYGGKQQGMSHTYGPDLKFIVFDVNIGDSWMDVPVAERISERLGLEFVPYETCNTDLDSLNAVRDKDSEVAIRRGMGAGKKREGVVLRPLIELVKKNGGRIISKHKRDDFSETKTPRVVDPEKLKVIEEANAISEEWVTTQRLEHVVDKLKVDGELPGIERMSDVINAMVEDVLRESQGEIVDSKDARKAISTKTAIMYKKYLKDQLMRK